MKRLDLPDEAILVAVRRYPGAATYVIRNMLSTGQPHLKTASVLRRLKGLELAGKVERAPSSYRVMICWRIARAK